MQFLKSVNPNVKFVVGAVALIVAIDFLIPCGTETAAPSGYGERGIRVRGECERKVEKDRTRMVVRIYNLDKDKTAASQKTITSYNKLLELLGRIGDAGNSTAGGAGLSIDTRRIMIGEKRQWNEISRRNELLGQEALIIVNIDGTDRGDFEKIISETAKFKDMYIDIYEAYVSKPARAAAVRDCIIEASEDARMMAAWAAEGSGVQIGRLISSHVYGDSSQPFMRPERLSGDFELAAKTAAIPELVHSDETITVSVESVYAPN